MGKGRGGSALAELVAVVAIIGILAAIAMPRMERTLAVIRTRGAANLLAADLARTRHMAVKTGRRARLVLEPSADCTAGRGWTAGHRYRIVIAGRDSVAARVDLRLDRKRLCLATNAGPEVVFTSRGLLRGFNNRTMVLRQGSHPADTLTLSAVGRVRRRY